MSKLEQFQFIIFAFSPHFLLFEIRQLCPSFFLFDVLLFYFISFFFALLFNPKKNRPETIMWSQTTTKNKTEICTI